jgi:hypothetical protein
MSDVLIGLIYELAIYCQVFFGSVVCLLHYVATSRQGVFLDYLPLLLTANTSLDFFNLEEPKVGVIISRRRTAINVG